MKLWKKNVVAAAILVTVCAGIYVNWAYGQDQETVSLDDTLNSDVVLGEDTLVMSTDTTEEITDVNTQTDYFSAVRLSRQEARDSAVSLLQEAMSYDSETDSEKTDAELENIVQTGLNEAQIESLVIAKGYTDCVAYISDGGISVAVAAPEGGLEQDDVAVIADIVMTQTDFGYADIRVVEVQ